MSADELRVPEPAAPRDGVDGAGAQPEEREGGGGAEVAGMGGCRGVVEGDGVGEGGGDGGGEAAVAVGICHEE